MDEISQSPLIGWRSWDLVYNYENPRLFSPQQMSLWAPGSVMEATCSHSYEKRLECNCGIHAFVDREGLLDSTYGMNAVIGEIDLWGDVQAGPYGYRGQFAKVNRLWVDADTHPQTIERLQKDYGVPVSKYHSRRRQELTHPDKIIDESTTWEGAWRIAEQIIQGYTYLTNRELSTDALALHLWACAQIQEDLRCVTMWFNRIGAPNVHDTLQDLAIWSDLEEVSIGFEAYQSMNPDDAREYIKLLDAYTLEQKLFTT